MTVDTSKSDAPKVIAEGVDDEPSSSNERQLRGFQRHALFAFCAFYTGFHLYSLNIDPMETWAYRLLHIGGALCIGFALMSSWRVDKATSAQRLDLVQALALTAGLATGIWAAFCVGYAFFARDVLGLDAPPDWVFQYFGIPLIASVAIAIVSAWSFRSGGTSIHWPDALSMLGAVVVVAYLLFHLEGFRLRAGTGFAEPTYLWVSLAGIALIMEMTRRVAGLALVSIAGVFLAYTFLGEYLPGFLYHQGYTALRGISYMWKDSGILGAPIAVSSTYIILFIAFAAFLSASKVGDYFVNFAFAVAGRARGGPAKVAVFASGLMGMINGTSAGNVVATGSLTIPLMKKVGYRPQMAASVEATASTGGQIMPPIMGAGAFIMAEITGIPYTDLIVAAIIPAVMYFIAVYFMVDLEAVKLGMRGLRDDELPRVRDLAKKAFLFIPVLILIIALFFGYTPIRAGTYALISAAMVSWLTPYRMGLWSVIKALELAARMAIQIIAVCACAGIIVGVIALTGVGARFSSLLLGIAETSQLLALVFAMLISILLGMGMPTTAAYAVAASVVAPGLQELGIQPLVAHFFVFYFAVVSAITPPVALAAYAGAAIAGSEPMRTSVTAFKIGLAAFVVPFMFYYSPALLMEGTAFEIVQVAVTGIVGVFLLASAVQGYYFGRLNAIFRVLLLCAALCMINGLLITDLVGVGLALAILVYQRMVLRERPSTPAEQSAE